MQNLQHVGLSLRHGLFRLRRRFDAARTMADAADKVWTIAPAETLNTPPSVFLPGEYDKVRTIAGGTTTEIEMRRVCGGQFERPPIMAYRYTNAFLYRGAVVARGAERRVLPYGVTPSPSHQFPVVSIREGALAGSYLGLQYFGHWLMDDAPLSLLAEQYGQPVSPSPPTWHAAHFAESHIHAYAKFLDLPWRQEGNVFFKSLVMFDDEDFTTHKGARLEVLRQRVLNRLGAPRDRKRVFIKRGISDKGVRRFHNEDAVAAALAEDGFDILDPTKASVEEIAQMLNGCDVVVGSEGSQQVHSLFFLPPGAGLLAITPPNRFTLVNKRWTDLLNIQYGFTVGDAEEEGFSANIDDIKRTIDLF
ncbi:MAG: glycosyltransferase family 61 protein [Alphaproteobacteria bacterium]|nr:glycosyltransferase family 61 protein [Alphaproteobacteria bacterium]